jgi:tetratricopeptide (TPR) repeat protein
MRREIVWARALTAVAGVSARAVIAGALVALAVGVLVAGAWWWSAQQARRAEAAYAGALAKLERGSRGELEPGIRAAVAAELEAALAQHPGAATAPLAAYELGNLRFAAREWARARGAYELAIARGAPPTVRRLARAGVAYTWEAEGDHARAVDAFRTALAGLKPGDFMYEELLLDLARAQEAAGRRDDAVATYRRFLEEVGKSTRADEVRRHLVRLGAAS